MTTSQPRCNAAFPPLHCFIEAMEKLDRYKDDERIPALKPLIEKALKSLQDLRCCADQLPDLSGTRWFLRSHFISARDQMLGQLSLAGKDMLILGLKAYGMEDPFEIFPFTSGFVALAESAMKDPVVIQKPYEMQAFLRFPEPEPTIEEDPFTFLGCDAVPDDPFAS